MGAIMNVAWLGSGKLGGEILKIVASAEHFRIKLLSRRQQSEVKSPTNVSFQQVDVNNHKTLVEALLGQDALVVFTKFEPFSDLDILQLKLIDAAIEARVKLYVPSEWAPDTAGGNNATALRIGADTLPPNPVIAPKRVVHNYLFARSIEKRIDYAAIFPGYLLERGTGFAPYNATKKEILLPDGGHRPFSTTSLVTLGKALTGLLLQYPETKNSLFYIHDGVTTFAEVVDHIESLQGTCWTRNSYDLEDKKKRIDNQMKDGYWGFEQFLGTLAVPFLGGLTVWKRVDNRRLGLEPHDAVSLQTVLDNFARRVIAQAEDQPSRVYL